MRLNKNTKFIYFKCFHISEILKLTIRLRKLKPIFKNPHLELYRLRLGITNPYNNQKKYALASTHFIIIETEFLKLILLYLKYVRYQYCRLASFFAWMDFGEESISWEDWKIIEFSASADIKSLIGLLWLYRIENKFILNQLRVHQVVIPKVVISELTSLTEL